MFKNKKIGLALGGGGARGLSHIGVIKKLEAEGIKPDVIAGTSMGAIVGACYAMGMTPEEMERIALAFNRKRALREIIDPCLPTQAMLRGKKAADFIRSLIGEATFNDAKIPLRIVATDLETGDETVIGRGSIVDAIMASISVPGIFPPVKIGKKLLIDGGVVNPTPIDVVQSMGADIVIAVDLVMRRDIKLENPSLITTLMQSYEIIRSESVKAKLAEAENGSTVIIKPQMRGTIDSFRFYEINKFIASGESAAQEEMTRIKRLFKK